MVTPRRSNKRGRALRAEGQTVAIRLPLRPLVAFLSVLLVLLLLPLVGKFVLPREFIETNLGRKPVEQIELSFGKPPLSKDADGDGEILTVVISRSGPGNPRLVYRARLELANGSVTTAIDPVTVLDGARVRLRINAQSGGTAVTRAEVSLEGHPQSIEWKVNPQR